MMETAFATVLPVYPFPPAPAELIELVELRQVAHRSPEDALELACAVVANVLGVKYSFFYEAGPARIGFTHSGGMQWGLLVPEDALHQVVFSECTRRNVPEYYTTEKGDSICVPVAGPHTRVGVLTAHAIGRHTFSDTDIEFLHAVANIIAEAIAPRVLPRVARNPSPARRANFIASAW